MNRNWVCSYANWDSQLLGDHGCCFSISATPNVSQLASQCSLHSEPIFRLLLKVAVNGTHQCESLNFCGTLCPNPPTVIVARTRQGILQTAGARRPGLITFHFNQIWKRQKTTVLAQDLCYSDPLSSVLTFSTHTTAVMTPDVVCSTPKLCIQLYALMSHKWHTTNRTASHQSHQQQWHPGWCVSNLHMGGRSPFISLRKGQ
jgi:hypothetical protein